MKSFDIDQALWSRIEEAARNNQQSISDYLDNLTEFRYLVDSSIQGIVVFQDGRFVFTNPALSNITGYSGDEMLAMSPERLIDLVHPDDRTKVSENIRRRLAGLPINPHYEHRIIRADGQIRYVEIYAGRTTYDDRPAIQAAYIDRTEQKQLQEAYRALVDYSFQGLLILQDDRIVFANAKASEILAYSIPDLLNLEAPLETLIHPDSIDQAENLKNSHLSGRSSSDYELKIVTSGGDTRWLHMVSALIIYQGQPALQSTIVDITQHREIEKKLAHAAAIIHSSEDAIIGKDLDGIVVSWNPAAERIYGYSAAEMVGNSISILVPPDMPDELSQILELIRQGQSVDHYETERMSKDGRLINISLTISPIRDEAGTITGASVIARDITDKKATEKALRENEARLRLITDNMSDMIIHTDRKGFVQYASPSALNLLDDSPETLASSHFSHWLKLVHPEDREILGQKFSTRLETGKGPNIGVFRRQFADGQQKWFEYTVSTSRGGDGSVIGFTFVLRNVNQRMEAVLALQESEGRLRQAMNIGRLGIWEWDIATDQTIWMGDMFRMYGITPEEFTGKGVDYLNFTLAEDQEKQQNNIAIAFSQGITEKALIENRGNILYRPNQFRILRPDGSICHVKGDAIAIVDEQGNPLRMIGVLQDVTEMQNTIDALHQSEERYRHVSELTSDFAYAVRVNADGSLDFEWMTEAFARITGYSFDNLNEILRTKLIHPQDYHLYKKAFNTVIRGEPRQVDLRIITADGSVRWLRTRNLPLWDETENRTTYIYGAAQDITEQRAVEMAMQQTQKLESLGVLAGSVAHDFNNLLTGILTNATLIGLKLDRNQPVDHYLGSIIEAVERAADITRQLLAYSGEGRFEIEKIHLNDQIRKNLKLLKATTAKNINLSFEPMEDLPLIEGDSGQIQQIIMNLIINAADAYNGRPGVVDLSTSTIMIGPQEIEHWGRLGFNLQPGSYVCLVVEDYGVGMDDQTLNHIFDPFFTTKETGRGLGLAAVQGIIWGHHGALTVRSEPGVGSRFQVLLPISHDQTIPAEIVEVPEDESSNNLILVVDDEADVRSAISDALTFLGHRILLAENGEEALTLYQNHASEIGLILLDIMMPVLSGKETLAILEKRQLAVPVILMSGYEEQKQERSQQSKNVVGFLKKPFRIDRMMKTINSALTRSSHLKVKV